MATVHVSVVETPDPVAAGYAGMVTVHAVLVFSAVLLEMGPVSLVAAPGSPAEAYSLMATVHGGPAIGYAAAAEASVSSAAGYV